MQSLAGKPTAYQNTTITGYEWKSAFHNTSNKASENLRPEVNIKNHAIIIGPD